MCKRINWRLTTFRENRRKSSKVDFRPFWKLKNAKEHKYGTQRIFYKTSELAKEYCGTGAECLPEDRGHKQQAANIN